MKNLRPIFFVFAALLMAGVAQAQTTRVRALIPFDFVVGDRAYSAGEYWLNSTQTQGVIQIDDARDSESVMLLSNTCQKLAPSQDTKLVFHRMGDTYFLYQVWEKGHNYGREFPRSETEVKMAQNHEKADTVIVAANLVK
jgi:hypothetical protein